MKILNLYAGIGGNRRLWGDEHEITSVENFDPAADVYAHFYPNDTLIRGDAHQYLLDHYSEFDFIWASPPCPTHSILNLPLHANGVIRYPDMKLYQEIIFLKQWGGARWPSLGSRERHALLQATYYAENHHRPAFLLVKLSYQRGEISEYWQSSQYDLATARTGARHSATRFCCTNQRQANATRHNSTRNWRSYPKSRHETSAKTGIISNLRINHLQRYCRHAML
jgi:hypothetical protein